MVSDLPAGRQGFQRFNAFKWFERKRHKPQTSKQQIFPISNLKSLIFNPRSATISNPKLSLSHSFFSLHFFVLIQRNEAKKNQGKPDRSARFA
jgi:hypothetical protein